MQVQFVYWYMINDLEIVLGSDYLLLVSCDKMIWIWNVVEFKLLKILDVVCDGGYINSVNWLLWLEGMQ